MKKVLLAVVLAGLTNTASAAIDAQQVFTWTGTVPSAPVSNNFVIAQPSGVPITNGIVTFTTDAAGKGVLTGSTELRFNVFAEDTVNAGVADTAKPATSYDYTLTSLAINSSGLAAEQDSNGYFAIAAANKGVITTMVKNTAYNAATGGETILSVVKSIAAVPSNQPKAGDSVDIQATIVVENVAVL